MYKTEIIKFLEIKNNKFYDIVAIFTLRDVQ